MQAWALVHSLAQRWTQIGRNPSAALGDIAPNIGSVVAIEKAPSRTASQVFPTFLALNSATAPGNGYFPAAYAPFKVAPVATGIPNTTNPLALYNSYNFCNSVYCGVKPHCDAVLTINTTFPR